MLTLWEVRIKKFFEVFENKELRKVFGCKRQKVELLQNGVQIWPKVMFGRGKHAEVLLSDLLR